LFEIVGALHPPRSLAGRLDRRQQQRHQNPDDGNHYQQFDKRKPAWQAAKESTLIVKVSLVHHSLLYYQVEVIIRMPQKGIHL
jgi:hypothetical protein